MRRETELVEYAKGLRNFPVPDQLTVDEAASIFDVWQSAKALHVGACPVFAESRHYELNMAIYFYSPRR